MKHQAQPSAHPPDATARSWARELSLQPLHDTLGAPSHAHGADAGVGLAWGWGAAPEPFARVQKCSDINSQRRNAATDGSTLTAVGS